MVHTISLGGAILLLIVAIILLWVIGLPGLLVLILVGVLLWYAFFRGNRSAVVVG
ncbi:MAG TPA: hypothetical protein VKT21_06300 [Thermoplasmata archaeon]|nr:hypothetical protein [Thermoplasmata archaeon]